MLDKLKAISDIRKTLKQGSVTIGSWMQIPNTSVAEIMGKSNYDWIVVDMEHGSMGVDMLPDLFRAIELGQTVPFARLIEGSAIECKKALDAGACGLIIPKIETEKQLNSVITFSCWPPRGSRGVGYSRGNLYGKDFDYFKRLSQKPMIIAMIESIKGVENLDQILKVKGLDAILIGPYDLSASMGLTGEFDHISFKKILNKIKKATLKHNVPLGFHLVEPDKVRLNKLIKENYQFIVYSLDAVILRKFVEKPS